MKRIRIKKLRIYIPIAVVMLLSACTQSPPAKPDWLIKQPVSSDRWYGIGIAKLSEDDYRGSAHKKATEEIGQQIQTHIKSTFTLTQTEINLELEQTVNSVINTRVDVVLPEVKLKDAWSDDNFYYVLVELLRDDYNRIVMLKKQKALNTAVDYLHNADKSMTVESFNYLEKALNEIHSYADFPLDVEYPPNSGETVNLFALLHIKAQEFNYRLLIEPDIEELSTTIGIKGGHVVTVKCRDKLTGKSINDLPLTVKMGNNDFTKSVVTNDNGEAAIHLFKVIDKAPVQYLSISVDYNKIVSGGNPFKFTDIAPARIKVNAKQPIVYMSITERNLNRKIENPFIAPVIMQFFVERYGAEFTDSKRESDFIIKADINTTAKSAIANDYGLFQTYADGTISIINRAAGKELYQKSLNNIMGADFTSLEGAGRNALKKMVKKLEDSIFQEIISGLDSK